MSITDDQKAYTIAKRGRGAHGVSGGLDNLTIADERSSQQDRNLLRPLLKLSLEKGRMHLHGLDVYQMERMAEHVREAGICPPAGICR